MAAWASASAMALRTAPSRSAPETSPLLQRRRCRSRTAGSSSRSRAISAIGGSRSNRISPAPSGTGRARSRPASTSPVSASNAHGAPGVAERSSTASAASSENPPRNTPHCTSAATSQGARCASVRLISLRMGSVVRASGLVISSCGSRAAASSTPRGRAEPGGRPPPPRAAISARASSGDRRDSATTRSPCSPSGPDAVVSRVDLPSVRAHAPSVSSQSPSGT